MNEYKLSLTNITKTFGRRLIFKEINKHFLSGNLYGFSGSNGSGKSTLIKIIAGIISATKGKVSHSINSKEIVPEKLHNHIGFVSPYLVLYDEFTAYENLKHFSKIRGIKFNSERADFLLSQIELYDRKDDLLKGFSSGMKQRMKFIFSLLHNPKLLLLDEPTSNLDAEGKDKIYEIIKNESEEKLIIIASNEQSDLKLCSDILDIEYFKIKAVPS
ncbi:MAG: ABC transporter ATP-binding protein [Ignavibacteriae bacterium]|nr:MAG: ABC transporter ATP-binding protein [Ignavibacteriota bacterium]